MDVFFTNYISETNKEVEIAILSYFITKTKERRKNIYFDSTKRDIMGGKYDLEVQLYTNKKNIEYRIPFIQFVVDDILAMCLEYIEPNINNPQ